MTTSLFCITKQHVRNECSKVHNSSQVFFHYMSKYVRKVFPIFLSQKFKRSYHNNYLFILQVFRFRKFPARDWVTRQNSNILTKMDNSLSKQESWFLNFEDEPLTGCRLCHFPIGEGEAYGEKLDFWSSLLTLSMSIIQGFVRSLQYLLLLQYIFN